MSVEDLNTWWPRNCESESCNFGDFLFAYLIFQLCIHFYLSHKHTHTRRLTHTHMQRRYKTQNRMDGHYQQLQFHKSSVEEILSRNIRNKLEVNKQHHSYLIFLYSCIVIAFKTNQKNNINTMLQANYKTLFSFIIFFSFYYATELYHFFQHGAPHCGLS